MKNGLIRAQKGANASIARELLWHGRYSSQKWKISSETSKHKALKNLYNIQHFEEFLGHQKPHFLPISSSVSPKWFDGVQRLDSLILPWDHEIRISGRVVNDAGNQPWGQQTSYPRRGDGIWVRRLTNGEREQDKKMTAHTLHNADLRDSHEYTHKQVWGEGIIKRFSFGRN